MTKRLQIYKCEICGNMVEMLHGGAGQLVCCNQPMSLFTENTVDAAQEKHVPVVKKKSGGVAVSVGSTPHPMDSTHYVEWIELLADGKSYRQFLKPDEKPDAFFEVTAEKVTVREYCNLHGLWKA